MRPIQYRYTYIAKNRQNEEKIADFITQCCLFILFDKQQFNFLSCLSLTLNWWSYSRHCTPGDRHLSRFIHWQWFIIRPYSAYGHSTSVLQLGSVNTQQMT